VLQWLEEHPSALFLDCARALGISKSIVHKTVAEAPRLRPGQPR
jgi:hypothetical protein